MSGEYHAFTADLLEKEETMNSQPSAPGQEIQQNVDELVQPAVEHDVSQHFSGETWFS
jgi:hypothetical protein